MIEIYTDGSCRKNPGNGGWAFVSYNKETDRTLRGWGTENDTTNNRMEMMAVIKALSSIYDSRADKHLTNVEKDAIVTVYTDSRYVIGGASLGWKQKKNLDLWTELMALVHTIKPEFKWVKGHNGDPRNEEVDKMAQEASGVR